MENGPISRGSQSRVSMVRDLWCAHLSCLLFQLNVSGYLLTDFSNWNISVDHFLSFL